MIKSSKPYSEDASYLKEYMKTLTNTKIKGHNITVSAIYIIGTKSKRNMMQLPYRTVHIPQASPRTGLHTERKQIFISFLSLEKYKCCLHQIERKFKYILVSLFDFRNIEQRIQLDAQLSTIKQLEKEMIIF